MSSKVLYTLVLDYRGGTYIAQEFAESPQEAVEKWAVAITEPDLSSWGLTKQAVIDLSKDFPLPLKNCSNVWCTSDSTQNGPMLLNIIATKTGGNGRA